MTPSDEETQIADVVRILNRLRHNALRERAWAWAIWNIREGGYNPDMVLSSALHWSTEHPDKGPEYADGILRNRIRYFHQQQRKGITE